MEVELYVFPFNGQERAATRAQFAQQQVEVIADGSDKPILHPLDTDDLIAQAFPGGKWHKAIFREKITGADREKIEAMQWRATGVGPVVHHPYRYGRALVLTLVKSWTFTEDDGDAIPTTEQGYNMLPEDVCGILEYEVAAWKDTVVPNLTTPLTIKSQN